MWDKKFSEHLFFWASPEWKKQRMGIVRAGWKEKLTPRSHCRKLKRFRGANNTHEYIMRHRTLCRRKTGDISLVKGDKREKTLNTLLLSAFQLSPFTRGMSEGQGVQRRRRTYTAHLFEYYRLSLRQWERGVSFSFRVRAAFPVFFTG